MIFCERFESEHACWDPKDGELCLSGLYLTGVKYDRDPGLGTWPPDSPPALYR
jgi:hypothetical protein